MDTRLVTISMGAALASVLVLAGCGSAPASTHAGSSATTTNTGGTSGKQKACDLLTRDIAQEVFVAVSGPNGSFGSGAPDAQPDTGFNNKDNCRYNDAGAGGDFSLELFPSIAEAKHSVSIETPTPVPNLGDEAYTTFTSVIVRKGNVVFSLDKPGAGFTDATVEKAATEVLQNIH